MVKQDFENQTLSLVLKCIVFLAGVGLAVLGGVSLWEFDFSEPADFFLSLYYILFGVLCILMELPWERTLTFFAFLKYCLGKSLFLLFCGTLVFDLDVWYRLIVGILLIVAGCIYLILTITCGNRIVDKSEKEPEQKPL